MERKKIKYTKINSIYIREPKSLDSLLIRSLKDLDVTEKLTEKLLIKFWKKMFSNSIINATNNIVYKNNSVTIYINSSVIKSELKMLKSGILEKFQAQFGKENIRYLNIF